MYSPEETQKILILRGKINAGTFTKEELSEGMALLRRGRAGAHATSAASKVKKAAGAAKKNINSDALLDELKGL